MFNYENKSELHVEKAIKAKDFFIYKVDEDKNLIYEITIRV
ncbi:MAG TPA: hypothetical protein VIK72_17220 [Clostridiaceae bacterium]